VEDLSQLGAISGLPVVPDLMPMSTTSSGLAEGSAKGLTGGLSAPTRNDPIGSGAWSTAATPGVRDEDESRDGLSGATNLEDRPLPELDGDNDEMHVDEQLSQDAHNDKKNVRFAGPDGAPLSPATTFVSMDSYVAPNGPPPTVFSDPDENKDIGSSTTRPSDAASSKTVDGPAAPSTPSAPTKITTVKTEPSAPLPSPEARSPVATLDTKSIERCQKHCKWAISALDYEDLDTARSELRKALAMLGG
jgi:vacuolar protein sorting-associated protein VTA1